MIKATNDFVSNALNLMCITPQLLDGARLHLYQSRNGDAHPRPSSYLEADFTGYPTNGLVITWDPPRTYDDGGLGNTAYADFDSTGPVSTDGTEADGDVTNLITGWYITDANSGYVLLEDTLPANKPMGLTGMQLNLIVQLEQYFDRTNWGQTIIG